MKFTRKLDCLRSYLALAGELSLKRKWSPQNQGRFPFNKNSALKFRKFHEPSGSVHSGCTEPTQATARSVIVLVNRLQEGTTILSNGKGPTDRNDQTDERRPPSKLVPNVQTKSKWSVPLDVPIENSGILG